MKTLIHNCHIIDVERMRTMKNAAVLINDDIIEQIIESSVDSSLLNSVDKIINGEEKYLIPGMINLHVHIQRRHLHLPGKGVFRQGAAVLENSSDMRRMVFSIRNGLD